MQEAEARARRWRTESRKLTLLAAFGAGLLSFISPCVLPLIPGYLSYISGLSLDEMRGLGASTAAVAAGSRRRVVLSPSLFFILGFSLVFIALGASAAAIGHFVLAKRSLSSRRSPARSSSSSASTRWACCGSSWLVQEKRVQTNGKPAGLFGAFLVGMAFAFGWTPCIGPILAGILALAGVQDTVGEGVQAARGLFVGPRCSFPAHGAGHQPVLRGACEDPQVLPRIEVVSGLLLCAIGLLIFTDRFTVIARWLSPYLPTL